MAKIKNIGREREETRSRGSGAAVLGHLAGAGEDDDGDLGLAQDADLPGLLDDPVAPLGEGHLPVG